MVAVERVEAADRRKGRGRLLRGDAEVPQVQDAAGHRVQERAEVFQGAAGLQGRKDSGAKLH